MHGIVTKIISNQYTVLMDDKIYICQARGKFRLTKDSPVVGDQVIIDPDKKIINEILPRINKFNRPPVANISYPIIMVSLKHPDLDLYLLDKLLVNVAQKGLNSIIIFTKIDLCNDEEKKQALKLKEYYTSLNYIVYFNNDIGLFSNLKKLLEGKIVTLTGQSGAGKSTFLNKLSPSLNLETHPISKALKRGVHTTRHCEIFEIEKIYFVDTPGFSSLDLKNMTIEELKNSFPEFKNINCRYQDCNHDKEDNCEIKKLVEEHKIIASRYNNYILFKKEIYENSRKFYK